MSTVARHGDANAYVIQAGAGQLLESLRTQVLATGGVTDGTMCVLVCTNPGPGGPPLHTHHAHSELFFVLEGRYRFKVGETEYEGGPGTFGYVGQDVVHTWASVGPEEGRLLAVVSPGDFSGFLDRLEELSARNAGHDEYASLYREYQSEINGPPLVQA